MPHLEPILVGPKNSTASLRKKWPRSDMLWISAQAKLVVLRLGRTDVQWRRLSIPCLYLSPLCRRDRWRFAAILQTMREVCGQLRSQLCGEFACAHTS
jgi:hypothetical protein